MIRAIAIVGVIVTAQTLPRITRESYLPFFVLGALRVPLAVLSVSGFGGESKPVSAKNSSN